MSIPVDLNALRLQNGYHWCAHHAWFAARNPAHRAFGTLRIDGGHAIEGRHACRRRLVCILRVLDGSDPFESRPPWILRECTIDLEPSGLLAAAPGQGDLARLSPRS